MPSISAPAAALVAVAPGSATADTLAAPTGGQPAGDQSSSSGACVSLFAQLLAPITTTASVAATDGTDVLAELPSMPVSELLTASADAESPTDDAASSEEAQLLAMLAAFTAAPTELPLVVLPDDGDSAAPELKPISAASTDAACTALISQLSALSANPTGGGAASPPVAEAIDAISTPPIAPGVTSAPSSTPDSEATTPAPALAQLLAVQVESKFPTRTTAKPGPQSTLPVEAPTAPATEEPDLLAMAAPAAPPTSDAAKAVFDAPSPSAATTTPEAGIGAASLPATPPSMSEVVSKPLPATAPVGLPVEHVAAAKSEPSLRDAPVRELSATAPTIAVAVAATSEPPPSVQRSEPTAPTAASRSEPNPLDRAVAHQVSRAIVQHLPDGGTRMVMRLTPPELGTVRIEFVTHDGVMTARLMAEDDGVRQALDRALPHIRADVRSDHPALSITVERSDQRQGWSEGQARQERHADQGTSQGRRRRDDEPAFAIDGVEIAAPPLPMRGAPTLGGRVTNATVDAFA